MTCIRVMIVGTSEEQLALIGDSLGDVLITPSAGPDYDEPVESGAKLIQFGRILVDNDLALHLYLISGQRRFAFMWSVLGRDMMGCLVLADPSDEESVARAGKVLAAVGDSGVPALAVGAGGGARGAAQLSQRLGLGQEIRAMACECGDRESVKDALCALLRVLPAHSAEAPATTQEAVVSVPVALL